MTPRDLAELVRLPAVLTVPGDTLAGSAALGPLRGDGAPPAWRTVAMPVASTCLYWAGMALNDWADRDLDAVERPERPIPSGRVRPREALGLAAGLTAAGVAVAAVAGGARGAVIATALAGAVWAYDTRLKDTPAGPLTMGAARGLDVLLGAAGHRSSGPAPDVTVPRAGGAGGGGLRAATLPAALLFAHTSGVTLLSRGEVHGTRPAAAAVAGALTMVTGSAAGALALTREGPSSRAGAGVAAALAATYAATVGRAQAAAVHTPDAGTVRRATGAGIRGMIPLQAALLARRAPLAALGLLAAGPVAKRASKVVSPT
ncbi:SCO3242 family prenyltransferase [Nocardioides insulae]|uniref:SCO3242 family prenyltransferase n=1 Tax=Nocardioides insulae TaxID=394734 RepID=UPI00041BA49C|nr:UbiA family prenyltransferase [Nocardioides insulae]